MDGESPHPAPYRSLASLQAEEARGGGVWQRIALVGGAVVVLGALGFLGWTLFEPKEPTPQRAAERPPIIIRPLPPPPPPPPPKADPPPEPQPARVQESTRPEPKPDNKPPPPAPRPAAPAGPPAGLGLPTGPGGANPYGIGAGGDGYVVGGGGGGGGGGDGRRSYHARAIRALSEAFQRDERLVQLGAFTVDALIVLDPSGRVLRARVLRTTGDAARDRRIEEVATTVSLGPPPAGETSLRMTLTGRQA